MTNNVSETMAQAVDKLVEYRISKAGYDKSYSGIISAILFKPDTDPKSENFGKYKVRYNNCEKEFKLNDGLVHQIGERVMVYIPTNNSSRRFIEPTVKRIVPYKITYDNDNDTFTEYRKIETDGKVFEIESEYKLTVENKGTDQEEVTKMTLPDGQEIIFEGWDI